MDVVDRSLAHLSLMRILISVPDIPCATMITLKRRKISPKALLLGALLAVALPGSAYANTVSVMVQTPYNATRGLFFFSIIWGFE